MHVLTLLYRVAAVLRCIDDLVREAVHHRLLVALARELDEPAHAQRERPGGANIDGTLIRRPTNAAALHFDARAHVAERALPHLQWIIFRPLRDHIERAVDDAFRDALLAVAHHHVDELRQPP